MTSDQMHTPPPSKKDGTDRTADGETDLSWVDIVPAVGPEPTQGEGGSFRVRSWALVLDARGIPCRSQAGSRGWQLLVPVRSKERAIREIRTYRQENRDWPPRPPEARQLENPWPTLLVLALLALFFNLTRLDLFPFDRIHWTALGSAHAGEILNGEWWRAITALTLHADGVHLLGNILIGSVFVLRTCRLLGSGAGWFLILTSGALGNVLNALVQSTAHRAVGASTALFGAIGILAGVGFSMHRRRFRRRQFLPLAGGAALLGLLGSGGENTDLGAHLFGFLAGIALGAAAGRRAEVRGTPEKKTNRILGLASALTVVAAWALAIRFGSVVF